jgi:Transglutaminase-like superfamily
MRTQFYILIIIVILLFDACKNKSGVSDPLKETLLYYMVHKSIQPDSMEQQVWHEPIYFNGLDPDEKELYFLCPRYNFNKAKMLQSLCIDTNQIFYAPCDKGDCLFGNMQGNVDSIIPFKFKISNLKFNTNIVFNRKLKTQNYYISLAALCKTLDSNLYYHTGKNMELTKPIGDAKYCANIGHFISKKGDTILTRLAKSITTNCSNSESKMQALLDFVSTEITYSYEDFWYQSEITKTAHEVLFTGIADCSGKSTLYASLLEQLDLPYCLFYFQNHLNIGLQGNFVNNNKYSFKINNREYMMAETTVPKFKIGSSLLQNDEKLKDLFLYQVPQTSPNVKQYSDNVSLKLFDKVEE